MPRLDAVSYAREGRKKGIFYSEKVSSDTNLALFVIILVNTMSVLFSSAQNPFDLTKTHYLNIYIRFIPKKKNTVWEV